ncbi:MAG: TRAP transporter substrate-binding protein [Rhodoferax sp.]|nr:TRAP transporter substrate-binding protein [Rhodoferax sp.]MBK7549267.1 TRAP transporter substrate-binding protein [Rhodoferax sp.]MBP6493138.1 TRAP transporter substrate-binding protein [Rhodoferax sp.]MBP7573634.1 TRAP transporter substrate-binding protein [Rhodoferax sp.]MBP8134905.1 TRAP transporter substrate-binding protein [Rhodoferax sp.]
MIQRRTLLKSTAAVALGAPALSSLAQQTVTLKFHTFMAPQSNVWLNMHKAWMDKVEKESGGRIKFEGYPAMQLGGTPVQLYDQAKDGVVDIIWTLPGNTAGRFPRVEVFELPFMMTNAEATSKAYWEYVQTVAADEFKDTQVLALQVHGPGMFHTKEKQIKTAADLKGLKMRGPTRQITKMLGYLGATPVGMPLPGIPDALSKGTIDGAVIPWEVVPSVKVHELTKFHSEFEPSGGALYTTTFVMAMNKAKYNSLPPDLKKIIDNNSGLETSGWLGKVQQAGDVAGRQSAVDRKNTIYTIPATDAQEFRRKAALVEVEWMEDMNKRGFDGRKLLDTARALIEKHTKTQAAPAKAAAPKKV